MKRKFLCIGIMFILLTCMACYGQKDILSEKDKIVIRQEQKKEIATERKLETMVLQDYSGNVELLRLLTDAFQDINPEYEVRIDRRKEGMISGWTGIERDLKNRILENEMPDLMLVQGMPEESFCRVYCEVLNLDIRQDDLIGHVADYNLDDEGWLGIPISFSVETMAISKKHGISYGEWTTEAMVKVADQGKYENVVYGVNGCYSEEGLRFLFGDKLTQEEESFVKKNSVNGLAKRTVGEIFHNDEALAFIGIVARVEDYKFINSLFDERAEFVGLPSAEGGGNKLSCHYLYPGKSGKLTEGCKKFMEFAMSKKGQEIIQMYYEKVNAQAISVRRDVVEDYIERKSQENTVGIINGVTIKEGGLDDDELEDFWRVLESAEYISK